MSDLAHVWGADLQLGPTGDLATASGAALTQQRVLRRLLTNPLDNVWQPDYGAGLARYVGQPGAAGAIRAAVRGQVFKESAVARTPEPVVDVAADPTGSLSVHVRYADAAGAAGTLSFPVKG